MPLEPEFCESCRIKIDVDEAIVAMARLQPIETEQAGKLMVPGGASVFHAGHEPEASGLWVERYRGALRGYRPTAT